MSPDALDRSERIIQKIEAIAQDPEIRDVFGGTIREIMRPRVLSGLFTPEQYRRVLRVFDPELSLSEIEQEIATAISSFVPHKSAIPGTN